MDKPTYYEIHVKGHLDDSWADSFDALTITNLENGEALLSGSIQDQSALQGVLNRISNLGLTLVSVNATSERINMENFLVIAFLIITPLISLAIPAFLSLPAEVVPLILIFIPAIFAILFTAFSEGRNGVGMLLKKLSQWRIGLKWYFMAFALALVSRLAISVLAILFGWTNKFSLYDWTPLQYVIIGIFTIIGSVMEELGWRGYALPKILARRSALASALIIGIPWGILHIGLTFPGQMNDGTSWVSTMLFLLGISVILTRLYVETNHGIVAGIIFHAAQNFFVFLNGGMIVAGIYWESWLLTGVTVVMAVMLIALYGSKLQYSTVHGRTAVDAS